MKSQVIELTRLAEQIYIDASAKCAASTPDKRDLETLRSRVEDEGLSFLTITLPNLGSDFERCLDLGYIDPLCFRSFRKYKKVPAFLRGFFDLVFDSGTGDLKDEPNIASIEGIRQMSYSFKKLKLPCTQSRVTKAIKGFIQCEQDLSEALVEADVEYFIRLSRIVWDTVLPNRVNLDSVIPRHGPGATQEGISGNAKYIHKRWHDRLEPFFPLLANAFHSESVVDDGVFEDVTVVCLEEEEPVRVITVPKTLKSPRIIAIEPVCMQYTQQGLSRVLIKALETHPLTAGHINFSDQTTNRKMALSSSLDERYATLDLSSASDRVPRSLALRMFDSVPDFRDAIDACRTRSARLPSGEVLNLSKFASMGSALCFPIEAMYFYTLCIGAFLVKHKLPVTYHNVIKASRYVYVYGDDIIIPVDIADSTAVFLQKYYCKINSAKSFWTGKFRESCGLDAYNGEEVTPTYVRSMVPDSRQKASELISWVETSNHFYKRGYWKTARHMQNVCERHLGVLPVVGEKCAGLGVFSYQCSDSLLSDVFTSDRDFFRTPIRGKKRVRVNASHQIREVRTWIAAPARQKDEIDGYPALMKCLLSLECRENDNVKVDKDHLCKTARHGSVTLKSRWVRPY